MSFPIDWTGAPEDDPSNPFFPDVPGWTKVIKSAPASIVSTSDDGFDFSLAGAFTLVPWTNPSNASANDGVNSASNLTEYDHSEGGLFSTFTECLYASGWGFAIPAGATIQAVLVSINGVIYDIANDTFFPPGSTPYTFCPFALHVDSGWEYLGGLGSGNGLDTITTGQQFSDGSWDGTPVAVGTDEVNFSDPSSSYPPAVGGLLPHLGFSGIILSPEQVNAAEFGIGFMDVVNSLG